MMSEILLSTAYLPPISYFAAIQYADEIIIEIYENYVKQSYRNRCNIMSCNGLLGLSIPVCKMNGNHTLIKDIRISYLSKWQINHWRAIESAYNKSPFFLYYRDDLQRFYTQSFEFLIDFNYELLCFILKKINLNIKISFTSDFIPDAQAVNDFRYQFSPKKQIENISFSHYYQVFEAKNAFIPDLSIIDLLFNEGPQARAYLNKLFVHNK
jgi:hypothetical protein